MGSGGRRTSSHLPRSRQTLEANTSPRIGLIVTAGGSDTGNVPQKSRICIQLFSQEILFIFLTLKNIFLCCYCDKCYINKNAFFFFSLTPETLRKHQICAELREQELPIQENRVGLEAISPTCFNLIYLLWFLFKSQCLPSYIILSFCGWQDCNCLCKIWYYFGSLFQELFHFC